MESENPPPTNVYADSPSHESRSYCNECLEHIFIPKPKSHEHRYVALLHRSLSDFIECRKYCHLCHYIHSLFGSECLSQIIAKHQHDVLRVSVYYSTLEANVDENKVFDYADLNILVEREEPSVYYPVTIDSRMFTICTSTARALQRPIWDSPHTLDFETRSSTIRKWIDECDSSHQSCKDTLNPDNPLAARILSVSKLSLHEFDVKLISTEHINLHKEKYLVLSHVWGDVDIPCKTTTNNIAQYLAQGLSYDELPPTFQDAIRITAALGVNYIWIDSLCIIQDDSTDWQHEAAKMASIYRAATLTISATSARNSLQGCGISTLLEPAVRLPSCVKSPLGLAVRGPEYNKSREILREQMTNSLIHTRAWIFQEQILSLRTLHAAHSQFVWQCSAFIESEDGLHYQDHRLGRSVRWPFYDRATNDRIQPHTSHMTTSHVYAFDQRWWAWVGTYTRRKLKVASDQYAALAGIVRFYQDIVDDEPVLGLWLKNLPLHLLWHARRDDSEFDHSALPEHDTRRPSWTWMTYPHGSVHIASSQLDWHKLGGGPRPGDWGIVYQATTIQTNISWSGEPLTSRPSGTVKIRGIVNQIAKPPEPLRVGYREHFMELDPEVPKSIQERDKFHTIALVAYMQEGSLIDAPPFLQTFFIVIEPLTSNRCIRIGWMRMLKKLPVISLSEYQPQGKWLDVIIE